MLTLRKKILIVEDEEQLARALEYKLNRNGFETRVAFDGEEAYETLSKDKYDLILLDIIMPKMDGITLLNKLQNTDGYKDIPVIVLTNLGEAEKTSEPTLEKITDFLVKSDWSLEDVVKKVKEKLSLT